METQKFTAKTFPVEGVKTTIDNMYDVARWCSGEVKFDDLGGPYIAWGVAGVNRRMAYVGDWICKQKTGFRKHQFKAVPAEDFEMYFEKPMEDPRPAVREILHTTLAKAGASSDADEVLRAALNDILEIFGEGAADGE